MSMSHDDFQSLQPGNLVREDSTGTTYIVTGNFGNNGITMVKTVLATNPRYWSFAIPQNETD